MAQSTEYPDLRFVKPRAWNSGRPNGRPLWIVIHTTEGSEGKKSAEDGTAYDARREDGTSTHYMHDQDSTIQEVRTTDRANAAKGIGNQRGIHHELCGKAAQNPTQWGDPASLGTIENAAKQAARDARKWEIPVRHLTVAQIRNYERGFCEHNDISLAFGESDHSDPGRNYPWSAFLGRVREILAPPPPVEEDPMAAITVDDIREVVKDAIVELYVAGYHAVLDDSFFKDMDPNSDEAKTARAVRDFILNPDFVAGGDPKARVLDVLSVIGDLNAKLDRVIAALPVEPPA